MTDNITDSGMREVDVNNNKNIIIFLCMSEMKEEIY